MQSTLIDIHPLSPSTGAEIRGVDLASPLRGDVIAEIRRALSHYCVVFFRDQEFDDEQHKALARQFGDLFIHPNFKAGPDPEIVEVRREPEDTRIVGEDWHTDTTMVTAPPMGAILYAQVTPPAGGDTLFANQYLAYESLSAGMKQMLKGMRAWHSDFRVAGPHVGLNDKRATVVRQDSDWQETRSLHPVVRTHPESGRRALFVNLSYTTHFENMTREDSAPLLDYLMAHGHRPEFTCRFRWEPGSVAFWDNRCSKHIAVHDVSGHRRVMRRVQIAGDIPV